MKATGIVRRIDDLGRIVIPKEIRRTQRIHEGDPIEIYTSRDGEIMLKKYSPILEMGDFANDYAESIAAVTRGLACVTDRESVIAAAGPKKKDYAGKALSEELENIMKMRTGIKRIEKGEEQIKLVPDDMENHKNQVIATIMSNGDCMGAVILCGDAEENTDMETAVKIVQTAATFLGKQLL